MGRLGLTGRGFLDAGRLRGDSAGMAAETIYPHIMKAPGEPARLEANPRTRVAQIVMDHLGHGWSADEIHRQHPHLSMSEIHAALAYYFDRAEEIDREIDEEWRESERLRASTPVPDVVKRLRHLKGSGEMILSGISGRAVQF